MVPIRFLSVAWVVIAIGYGSAAAQPPQPRDGSADQRAPFRLSDDAAASAHSARRAAADAAAQMRRDRAIYQAQQRVLRIEANAWLGVTPLRPTWPSTPSTHSYYPARRIIYIPIDVH